MTPTYDPGPKMRALMRNEDEVWRVLHLITAEFQSDPMSVQCFDARVVERAKACITARMGYERAGDLPPLLTEGRHMIEAGAKARKGP